MERHRLAARPDRLRQRTHLVRHQDDDRIRRRLLEILEQRVRRLVVQQMRTEDHVHPARGLERPQVQVAPQLAHRVDPDLIAQRLEHVEIGMRAPADPRVALQQLRRECQGSPPLPHTGRPVEQVRVRRAFAHGRREQSLRLGLLRNAVEARQEPLARSRRRGACRRW